MELAISTEKVSTVTQVSPSANRPIKNSQKSLLIGAIKRKGDPLNPENSHKKPSKLPMINSVIWIYVVFVGH